MNRFAQLDNNNIVVSDSWLSYEVHEKNMIPIPEFSPSPLGKKYVNGEFIDVPPQDPPITPERIQESIAINTEYLVTLVELGGSGI